MEKMMLLAPNFSEYKNRDVVDEILDCFRKRDDLYFVNWQGDETYNRFSPSYLGEPEAVIDVRASSIEAKVCPPTVIAMVLPSWFFGLLLPSLLLLYPTFVQKATVFAKKN